MFRRPFPFSCQMDSSDCGAACLRMIAKSYGRDYSLNILREYSHISRGGASLMGVCDAAEEIGFHATGVKATLHLLREKVPLPCILHWKQNHYVVLYRIRKRRRGYLYHIADPSSSLIVLTEEEFGANWFSSIKNGNECGIVLVLQPTARFYQQESDVGIGRHYGISSFFKYLLPYRWQLIQIVICMLLYMVLGFVFPFLTQALVDIGVQNGNLNFVLLVLSAQLVLTITDISVRFFHNWLSLHVNTRIDIALLADFWKKLMNVPIRFFDTKMTGDLMQRLSDHGRIRTFLTKDSIGLFFSSANIMLYGVLLAFYDCKILLIFIAGHALYVAWVLLFLRYRKILDYKSFEIQSQNRSCVIQLIQGMQEIKMNNDERHRLWEWENLQAQYFQNNIKGLKIEQIKQFGARILTKCTGLTISYIVARQVIEGEMTLGMMMAVSYIVGQISGPISNYIGIIHSLQNAKISLERLNEIHEIKDEIGEGRCLMAELPTDKSIYLKDVSFSYSGSSREFILTHVDLHIPQHKITAIVGASGSGKTTIMKLLQGFYVPQEGKILVGGIPLQSANLHVWREKVGAVMQDSFVFSDTIAENIAVGEGEIDMARLKNAAHIANIDEFISNLPLGYNTKIGMEGNGISQGQRQRILIARAIYKDPEYLFLDEATNALDSNNEKQIVENLMNFCVGKTVVISAHRLSTIRHADQIIVLKNGSIVEKGSHEELMALHGGYYHLVESQL